LARLRALNHDGRGDIAEDWKSGTGIFTSRPSASRCRSGVDP